MNQETLPLNTYGELCKLINLNWAMAMELHEKGFLQHQPDIEQYPCAEAQAELIFIGSMIANNCTMDMLKLMLAPLEKPYAYSHDDIYFDWGCAQWKEVPSPECPSEVAFEYIGELSASKDLESLNELKLHIEGALSEVA